MGAFLIQGLAIPHAFSSQGVLFGLADLTVVLVHSGLFRLSNSAIDRTILFNLGSALLVIAAGMAHGGTTEYWLWGAAMLVQFVTPRSIGFGQIRVEPAYFVERHGLLTLVHFGESGFFYAPVPILLVSSPEQPRGRASADTSASRSPPVRPRHSPSAFSFFSSATWLSGASSALAVE